MKTSAIVFTAAFLAIVGSTAISSQQAPESIVQGTVVTLPKNTSGTWLVRGGGCEQKMRAVKVNPQTLLERKAAAGSDVEIVGRQKGGYFVADQVRVISTGDAGITLGKGESLPSVVHAWNRQGKNFR